MFYKIIYKLKGGNTVPEKDFDNEQNSHHVNSQIITKEHQLISIDGSQLNTKMKNDILNFINIFNIKNFDILKKDDRIKNTVGDPLFILNKSQNELLLNTFFNLNIIKSSILSSTQVQLITDETPINSYEASLVHSHEEIQYNPNAEDINTTQTMPLFVGLDTIQYSSEEITKKIRIFTTDLTAQEKKLDDIIIELDNEKINIKENHPSLYSLDKKIVSLKEVVLTKRRSLNEFYDKNSNIIPDKYKEIANVLEQLNNYYDEFLEAKRNIPKTLEYLPFEKSYDIEGKLFDTGKIELKDKSPLAKANLTSYLNDLNLKGNLGYLFITKEFINLPFNLSNLKTLEAPNCDIVNIPGYFKNLNNLELLNLSYNNISDLTNLSDLKNLEILILSHNNISEINALLSLKKLHSLLLSHNNISEINEINLPNLKDLNLSNNKIHSIDRIPIGNLEKLNLSNNNLFNEQIGGMDATFSPTPLESSNNKLKLLNLSNNKINRKIFEYIINNNFNLKALYLDNITNIEDLDPDFFNDLINIVNSKNTLKVLSLSKNSLFRFNFDLSNSNNYYHVNLSRNNLNSKKILELRNLIIDTKEINLNDNNFDIKSIEIQVILNGSQVMNLDGNNIRDEGMIHLKNIISNSKENNFEISIKRNYITDNGINNFYDNNNERSKIIRRLDISHNINFGNSIFELIRYYKIKNLINKNNIYNEHASDFSFKADYDMELEIYELDISNTSDHSNNYNSFVEVFPDYISDYKLNVMNLKFDNYNLKNLDFIPFIIENNESINISARYNNLRIDDISQYQNINLIGNYDSSNNQFVNYFKDKVYNLVPSFNFGVDDLFPLFEHKLGHKEIKLKKFKNLDSIENSGKLMVSMHPFYEIIPLNFDILNEEKLKLYEYKNTNAKFNIVLTNLIRTKFLFFKNDLFEDNNESDDKGKDDESYINNNCEYFMNLNEKLYLSFESAAKLGIIPRKNDKIILYKDFQFFDFDFEDIEIHKTMLYDKNNDSYTNEYGLLYKENESANTSSQPVNNFYKFQNLINLNSNLYIYDKLIKNKNELMKIVDEYMGNEKEKTEGELEYFKNLDLSLIDDLSGLFSVHRNPKAIEFNLDISGWKTSNVVNANSMFYGAEEFNQDISGWNTQSLKEADYMFFNASQFSQDLSKWNLTRLESADFMFYGTNFNEAKNDWILDNLNFAYQMFNDNFNKEKDLTIQSRQLKTTNVSLNKTIKIIESSIRKSVHRNIITISKIKYDRDIDLYYDDFPNFKSFWGNIFINNFDSLANYKVFIRGELARNHIDTVDVGGITKSYLYSDFIKYSIYTHDMNRINENINNYTEHFKKSCEIASGIIDDIDDIEVNIINRDIKNKRPGVENILYNYACKMFTKMDIISRTDTALPAMPTNPINDDFINNFFSDINLDSNRRKLIDLIYKIYDYKKYLNEHPKPILTNYTENIQNYNNNMGQARMAFQIDLGKYQPTVDKKLKEIHIDFFKIFKEQLSTTRLKDYYELKKQSKLYPFIFKENKLLLNKDIISVESRDYFREIYGIVMETGIQAPAQDDVISILYKKIGNIFASYLTHEIRFMDDRRGYAKDSIKLTKMFLLFLFREDDKITIPELLDAILEISNFNIAGYLENENPIGKFLSDAFNDDYKIFLNEYIESIEDEEAKGEEEEEEEETFNGFAYDFFNNEDTAIAEKYRSRAKLFCLYNFILDKTLVLLRYWRIFKDTINSQIEIGKVIKFKNMISYYTPEIVEEKVKYLNLLNEYIRSFHNPINTIQQKKLKALNFFRQIIEESDTNVFDPDSESQNLNLPEFFKKAFSSDSSPDNINLGFHYNHPYFIFHLCSNQIEIPMNEWEISTTNPNVDQEFLNFRRVLIESVYGSG